MKKLLQLCSVLMLGLLFLAGNAQAQDLYVDGAANPANITCTFAAPCNTLTKAITAAGALPVAPRTIFVTGITIEPATVNIPAAIDQYTIVGSDPLNPGLSQITMATPTGANDPILYIADGSVNHIIRDLTFTYGTNPTYSEGALVEVFGDGSTFDNVIFRGTTGSEPIRYAIIDDFSGGVANSSNTTIQNSRFEGEFARRTIYLQRGNGWTITNNKFLETHVGTNGTLGNGIGASAYFDSGAFVDMNVTFTFNIVAPLVDNSGVGSNNGQFSGLYINQDGILLPAYIQLYEHNTFALRATGYSGDVTVIDLNGAGLISNVGNGNLIIRNNIISGGTSAGTGLGVDTPAPLTTSQFVNNIFFNNGTDFTQPISPLPPYNNQPNTDPLFENGGVPGVNEDYAYLPNSPALGASTNFPATPNIGFNQELNSTVPFAYDFTASGVAPQNLSSPFLANEDITFSWIFVDPDAIDEDPGNPGNPRQTNFIIEIKDNAGNAVVPPIPFDSYDAVVVGGASAGWTTSFTLPAGTLPTPPLVNTTYRAYLTVVDAIGLEGGTFDDALQTNPVPYIEFVMQANSAPTASNFTVDGFGPNPAVNNVNPIFGFTYNDVDGDPLTEVIVDVYRITANCGANCAPLILPPTPGSEPDGPGPGLLVTSTSIPKAANDGDPVTFNYYDLVPIQEQLIANETYVWRLRVVDSATNQSPIYNNYGGDGLGLMTFTTVPLSVPSVSDFLVQANAAPLFKDNSISPRVVVGRVGTPPNLRFTYNGFDTMKSYEIRILRTGPAVTTTPQGDLTGGTLVHYTGILAASDPNLNEYAPKQYEWAYQGALDIQNIQTHYAQVRVYNQQNQASDWEYIEFTRNATPTATDFLADGDGMVPVPVDITDDIVPTITWTFSDADEAKSPDDEGQSAFHIQIFDNIGFVGTPIVDTGKVSSTDSKYTVDPDLRLLYNTVYFVRIRVWDGLDVPNAASTWINAGAFRTPPNQPATLDITMNGNADASPTTNFTVDNATPQFDWVLTDPELRPQFSFQAQLQNGAGVPIETAVEVLGNVLTYVYDPADFNGYNLVPGMAYRFQVTSYETTSDGSDVGAKGAPVVEYYPFTYAVTPSAPADLAVTPTRAGGTLVSSLTPTFTFTPTDADGEPALTFQIQIQDAANTNIGAPYDGPAGSYTNGVPVVVTLATMYPLLDLDANANYRWRVYTTDQHGDGVTSAWQTFTVDPVPGAPTALTVNGFGTGNPGLLNLPLGSPNATLTFGWTDNDHGDSATGHSIVIYETANPGNVVYSEPAGLGGSPQVETTSLPLAPGTTYTWELRTSDASGMGFLPAEYSPMVSQDFRISAAPTAVDLLVDGVAANPEVLTVFPTFSWTFGDIDLDTQTASEVIVTRTSTLCGGLPICQPAPHLVWSSGKLANVNPSVVFGDGGPIIEGILPGESYSWTLRVWDSNDIPSIVYNSTFTASENLPAEISSLTLDAQSYVPGGTPATRWLEASLNVATGTPTFAWVFGGPGAQAKYQIEVSTSPTFAAGQFVWQTGEVVSGDVSVVYGGAALATGTTYYARVRAFNGQNLASPFGYIEFELNQAPLAPGSLQADALALVDDINTLNTVNDRIPTLTWSFADPNTANATDEQTEFEVEIATATDFLSVLFSYKSCTTWTGNVCTTNNVAIDGTLETFTIPVDQLEFAKAYAVRVRTYDKHGVPGPWAKGAFRTPANTPPVISDLAVLDGNPTTNPAQVLTLEPDFDWAFSDANGHGHGFSRVVVTRVSGNLTVYDTGIVANAASAHAFDALNVLNGGLAWGTAYEVSVTAWDDFSDPLNFGAGAPNPPNDITEQASNTLTLAFSTSAFNLVPVSITATPPTINNTQQSLIEVQLSTPYAWATITRGDGMTEVFFASVQADGAGLASISSGLLAAGVYTYRAFETPVELNAGNFLALTYGNGASFVQASLTVITALGTLGDVDGDSVLSPLDAVIILQYVVGTQTLTPAQFARADVDGNAVVNSLDASFILAFLAGNINCLPLNGPCKIASDFDASGATIGAVKYDAEKQVRLAVSGTPVMSLQLSIDLNELGLTAEQVSFTAPEGWMVATGESGGVVTVAMAGNGEVDSFEFATIDVSGLDEAKRLNLTAVANSSTISAALEVAPVLPSEFALSQNFPNPFNPSTEIGFSLPADANVVLEVFSVTGQKVATLVSGPVKAGAHTVRFDAGRLSSGVYIYRIQAGAFTATQKMTLIK